MSLGAAKNSKVCYGCVDWANNERTLAYHKWACANNLYPPNCVPELLELCSCPADSEVFVDPITDEVCWYDPAIPESSEFLGAIVLKISGLEDSTFTRQVVDGFAEGSILSRPTVRGRSFGFEVLLIATSCEGMAFGLEWLRGVLEDTSCPDATRCESCSGRVMRLRKHCPPDEAADDGLREWLSVGLVDGITEIAGERRSCCCVLKHITFTMTSESPYSFSTTEIVVCDTEASYDAFVRCYDFTQDCLDCIEPCCDKCGFDNLCNCFPPVRIEPVIEDDCYCEPVAKIIQCCCIDDIPGLYDSTFKIDIYSGTDFSNDDYKLNGLRNFNLKIFDNPRGYDCITDEESYNDWCIRASPCAHLVVNYIPEDSTITIDGRTGKITLDCLGRCVPFSHVVTSPIGQIFPLIAKCHPLMICAEWDYYNTQALPGDTGISPAKITARRYLRFRN